MSLKNLTSTLFFTLLFLAGTAQNIIYKNYKWDDKPAAYKIAAGDTTSEIILNDHIAYQAEMEDGEGVEYYFRHIQTFLNSNEAIERNNQVYLPAGLKSEIIRMEVRVVKPDGSTITMDSTDVKEAVDEATERKYQYLAVRGLETGCIVEQLFLIKTPSDFTGRVFSVQSQYPKQKCTFELIYPDYLFFEFKSFNGFPELVKDTSYNEKGLKYLRATTGYIPALKDEKYANRVANLQQVAYKLIGNDKTGKMNLNSYDKVSNILYQIVNQKLSGAENKALGKILKTSGALKAGSDEEKIRMLEDYLKKTVFYSEEIPFNSVPIDKMLQVKAADAAGLTRLYIAALTKLEIEHQIMITCNHLEHAFQKDFESYSYLEDYFVYFPAYDRYLSPTHFLYRYGFIPFQFRNNHGLFIQKVSLGKYAMGMGKVRFIKPDDYRENTDSMVISVDFSKGMEEPLYNYRLTNSGHEAVGQQCLLDYMTEEKKKDEVRKAIFNAFFGETEIENFKVENEGTQYFGLKPFVVNGTIASSKFLDKAGAKYLFKVGELIGPQEQLYQEETRKMPIEMNYCKNYVRTINFKIPEGYKVANAEKLNMDITLKNDDGEKIMGFVSSYKIANNQVSILVEEYYKEINLPVSQYEPFKAVINASADFNKIVLLFEPK